MYLCCTKAMFVWCYVYFMFRAWTPVELYRKNKLAQGKMNKIKTVSIYFTFLWNVQVEHKNFWNSTFIYFSKCFLLYLCKKILKREWRFWKILDLLIITVILLNYFYIFYKVNWNEYKTYIFSSFRMDKRYNEFYLERYVILWWVILKYITETIWKVW